MKKHKHRKSGFANFWHRFAFKHTVSAVIVIAVFVLVLDTAIVQTLMQDIISLGYLGMLLTGVLFVSFFTAAPAVVLLLAFSDSYNSFVIALIAGFGAMLGDYVILRFAEDKIGHELKPVAKKMKLIGFINLLHKKKYKPITATIGAIIVASPLPDEAGIALLGLSRISTMQLLLLIFALNSAGIFILITAFS
ncbi:MAG: hypothetical protein AAB423_00775 [Patescibacteria group bacterium]|mgnify:CR=1 FL=1